ncbi:MAG: hypothetical protein RL464_705, partial [Actinomycetota bacterium]
MKKKLFKGFAVAAALALSAGVVTPAHAANEIVVWADE